jgi:FMN reductase
MTAGAAGDTGAAAAAGAAADSVAPTVLAVLGNPRAESRTHGLARTLVSEVAAALDATVLDEVDLAVLGAAVLDWGDAAAGAAVQRVLAADVLVLSSPTYKGSYSGLLKAFLDRVGGGALAGAVAIPILLGGAPNHSMAVNVHFAPLLVELGAVVPGGLFVLESDVAAFPSFAPGWVAQRRALLAGAVASHRVAVAAAAGAAAAKGDAARAAAAAEDAAPAAAAAEDDAARAAAAAAEDDAAPAAAAAEDDAAG